MPWLNCQTPLAELWQPTTFGNRLAGQFPLAAPTTSVGRARERHLYSAANPVWNATRRYGGEVKVVAPLSWGVAGIRRSFRETDTGNQTTATATVGLARAGQRWLPPLA